MGIIELLAVGLGLLLTSIGAFFTERRRRGRAVGYKNSSVLWSYYSDQASILPLARTKIAGLRVSTVLFTRGSMEAILASVELPFLTKVHLLGIPKTEGIVPLNPAKKSHSIMEEVMLEGDYPSYFKLYAEKGQQFQARYVFDPSAMAYTVDFCRSHNWEIVEDMLIFVATSGTSRMHDKTLMWDDIDDFVEEIRPAIEKPLTPKQQRARIPYGTDRRETLDCPICASNMPNTEQYFACPENHGVLIMGGFLKKLRDENIEVHMVTHGYSTKAERESFSRPEITCPSCKGTMQKVQYNMSDVIIDACSECTYRWLDAHELTLKA